MIIMGRGWKAAVSVVAMTGGLLSLGVASADAAASCGSTVKTSNTSGTTYANVPSSNGALSGTGCVLGSGNTGNGVRALQRTLNYCYGAGLSVDGSFGSATRSALASAQRRAGVSDDGVYGPNTRDAINHAYYRWTNNAFFACSSVYV